MCIVIVCKDSMQLAFIIRWHFTLVNKVWHSRDIRGIVYVANPTEASKIC